MGRRGHSGQRAQYRRRHICRTVSGLVAETERGDREVGQGAILEVLEPSFSVSNGD